MREWMYLIRWPLLLQRHHVEKQSATLIIQEARSALHLAAESGNADICEMLLAKNAYVNSKTKAGWTPLHYVAFNGFNELIHPLVTKHNAAIDATSMVSLTRYFIGIWELALKGNYLNKPFYSLTDRLASTWDCCQIL